MSALAGFILGYVLGAKQGPESYEKLLAAWQTITSSPEVKGLIEQLPSVSDLMNTGSDGVLARIKSLIDARAGGGNDDNPTESQRPYARTAGLESLFASGLAMAGNLLERGLTLVRERQS